VATDQISLQDIDKQDRVAKIIIEVEILMMNKIWIDKILQQIIIICLLEM